jgi:hypothetical protein
MPRSGASGRSLRTLPACAAGCWPPRAGARALYPDTDEMSPIPAGFRFPQRNKTVFFSQFNGFFSHFQFH